MTITESKIKEILIIEDNEDMQHIYRSIFEDYKDKYEIELVGDARIGYKKVESKKFDMIILDIIMEPMSGDELYSCVRLNKGLSKIPILVVSVMNPGDLEHFKKDNNVLFLQKPVTEVQLIREVKKLIG